MHDTIYVYILCKTVFVSFSANKINVFVNFLYYFYDFCLFGKNIVSCEDKYNYAYNLVAFASKGTQLKSSIQSFQHHGHCQISYFCYFSKFISYMW